MNVRQLSMSSAVPVFAGTRSVVLALAQHRKAPVQTYESKESPWAPRTVVYAHYDDSILAGAHPHFKAYKDSKKYHSRVGMVTDATRAETTGALALKRLFCACQNCRPPTYDFANCLVKDIVGNTTRKETKRVAGAAQVTTQTQALADFSVKLKKGACWPVLVDDDQRAAEGKKYWICKLEDKPERLTKGMTYAGQTFDAGFIVVKVKWMEFLREKKHGGEELRMYSPPASEQIISVSAIIRLDKPLKLQKDTQSKAKVKPLALSQAEQARISGAM